MKKTRPAKNQNAAGANSRLNASGEGVSFWRTWWPAILIATLVIWAFFPTLQLGFVTYDDPDYVTANERVHEGLSPASILWAFDPSTRVSANWHPLTMVSHLLDFQLYGIKPFGHHLTSLVLHTLNSVLLLILLRRMTGALWCSLAVAAWFGLHPAHVESVAWISERKDVLSGFFWMLTLLAYHQYVRLKTEASPQTWKFYFLAVAAFLFGLLSKPMLVTLPFVLLLLDYWPLNRFTLAQLRPLLVEKIPFFLLTVASSVITYLVQKQAGATLLIEPISFGSRVANALVSYLRYLGLLFWPTDLVVFYPFQATWPLATVVLAIFTIGAVTLLAVSLRRDSAYLPVGWFWFLGTLVPVIGFVQVGAQSIADRYTYLPSIGLFVVVAWGADEIRRRWRAPAWPLGAVAAATALACLIATPRQIEYWDDSETLFRRVLARYGDHFVPQLSLGVVLLQKGRNQEAITALQRARELNPNYPLTYLNLGAVLQVEGRTEEAIEACREATRLQPTMVNAWGNLARSQLKAGDSAGAVESLQRALALAPNDAGMRHLLGIGLRSERRFDEAIAAQRSALELQPGFPQAREQLVKSLVSKGQVNEARKEWRTISGLTPDSVVEHNSFGVLLAETGQLDAATAEFEAAARIEPDNPDAKNNLAQARKARAKAKSAEPTHPEVPISTSAKP